MQSDWTPCLAAVGLTAAAPCLEQYRDDLVRFNRGRNLVSRQAAPADIGALVLEAALAGRALPASAGARVLDLGSGAGLPGIPVAILRPDLNVVLLERRRVRCEFLRREALSLRLENLEVLEGDARLLGRDAAHSARYALVLLKAVARPAAALGLALPFLAAGGRAVIFGRAQGQAPGQAPAGGAGGVDGGDVGNGGRDGREGGGRGEGEAGNEGGKREAGGELDEARASAGPAPTSRAHAAWVLDAEVPLEASRRGGIPAALHIWRPVLS